MTTNPEDYLINPDSIKNAKKFPTAWLAFLENVEIETIGLNQIEVDMRWSWFLLGRLSAMGYL